MMLQELYTDLRAAGYRSGYKVGGALWVLAPMRGATGDLRGPFEWIIAEGEEAGTVTIRRALAEDLHAVPATVAGVMGEIERLECDLSRRLWPTAPEYHVTGLERPQEARG